MTGEQIEYRLGPVSAAAARLWLDVSRRNVAAVVEGADRAPFRIPPEVAAALVGVLDEWQQAAASDPFEFVGREDPERARVLLTYWLNIVSLTQAQRQSLGVADWPPESVEFESALERAIIAAIGEDERLRRIRRARRARR